MAKATLYNKNGNLKARFYEEGDELFSSQVTYGDKEEALDFLKGLKKYSKKIRGVHLENQNLIFKLGSVDVVLHDYKDFKKMPELKFVFEELKQKKYKLTKERIKKVGIAVAAGLVLAGGVNAIATTRNNDKEKNIEDTSTTVSEDITQKNENTTITYEEVKGTTIESVTESATIDELSEKYDELNIGSDTSSSKAVKARKMYYYLIKLYSEMYNLNPELVLAIATQERGEHSSVEDSGGAIGLMQVQVNVWHNETINVFNYKENKTEEIYMTLDKLKDLEFNIKAGCAIFQDCLKQFGGNVIAAVQAYNTGPSAVKQIIDTYARSVGKTRSEVLKENDLGWLDYRTTEYKGDPEYVEHVLRYFPGSEIDLENNSKSK